MKKISLKNLEKIWGGSYGSKSIHNINPDLYQKYMVAKKFFDSNFALFDCYSYDVHYKNLYTLAQKPFESFLTEKNKKDPIYLGELEVYMEDFIKYVNFVKNNNLKDNSAL